MFLARGLQYKTVLFTVCYQTAAIASFSGLQVNQRDFSIELDWIEGSLAFQFN